MSQYPDNLDDDADLPRVDDNITEVGGDAINAAREAIFAIEEELGTNPAGSATSVAERFNVAHNPDGTLKDDSLNQIGVASFPIDDPQVADNAGIKESKLALNVGTSNLQTQITVLDNQLEITTNLTQQNESKLNGHLQGSAILPDGSTGRHVLSHIDVNDIPSDIRDNTFIWDGISDKDGNQRQNTNLAVLLVDINESLIDHENGSAEVHPASAISVNTDAFEEIPIDATNVQTALNYIDQAEVLNLGEHRATQHSAGVPQIARSNLIDQVNLHYSASVVPDTPVKTYLKHSPNTFPVDDLSIGDDLIQFFPENTNNIFDGYFSQAKIGDVITVTYDNGIQTFHYIDSIKYLPGAEFIVRINGYNLFDADGYGDGYVTARIDKARFDRNTSGVFAVASANPTPSGSFSTLMGSVIVGSPRGATALGLGFNPSTIDSSHYNLYLELYPTGNPLEKIISLPAIDISGDGGTSPGNYNIENIVQATNNKLREIGYNYRFIAFEQQGEFGIMLADAINRASFAIINGNNSSGTLVAGTFTNNVIGGNSVDDIDPLGLGPLQANLASPSFLNSWPDSVSSQLPTKIITPFQHRFAYVNGKKIDTFADTYLAIEDGYWPATILSKNQIGLFTVETTYSIAFDLSAAELKNGKTIVVQPQIALTDLSYSDADYGRFIIKTVTFTPACDPDPGSTLITVINGVHGEGDPLAYNLATGIAVKLYFGEDSVSFNYDNIINQFPSTLEYYRLHEIYVTDEGKTFSHERARMPRQSETSVLLGSNNWHLLNISSKLRGYTDGDGSFNKYVRLYISSYDSSSGEFDGYVGQRDPFSDLVLKQGETSHGKKNVPVKFYDETGIDYIELEFRDSASPGNNILSTASPRYVDIELFSSLELHDELLLLATCEVNWDPASGVDVIQHVKNRREFGSIKSDDLTQEAIAYIAKPEQLLHSNGVINGLDFVENNDLSITIQGGNALIDGKIISVNPSIVNVSEVWRFGIATPQTMTWLLCLNKEKQFEFVILTDQKEQFFATPDGINSYLLSSYTFYQLVNTQPNLLPLYLITLTVSSPNIFTSVTVSDIRKFIKNETKNIPLSIFGEDLLGNFESFSTAALWLKKYTFSPNGQYIVYVKGNIEVNSTVDLTGFASTVIFTGDGGVVTVNSNIGFNIESGIQFKNINFIYTASIAAVLREKINVSSGGCIYSASTRNINGIKIENCTFTADIENNRPTFIIFKLVKGQILDDVVIKNNIFTDTNADTENNAAIAIINLNTGSGGFPAALCNLEISNNICTNYQGIYITSSDSGLRSPGLSVTNCIIEKNQCGAIGYHTSGLQTTLASTYHYSAGLIINENTCRYIGSIAGNSLHVLSTGNDFSFEYPTSDIIISKNQVHWIDNVSCTTSDEVSEVRSNIMIIDNICKAWDVTWKDEYTPDGYAANNIAIQLIDSKEATNRTSAIVKGNITCVGSFNDVSYNYYGNLLVEPSATISNNIFRGIGTSGLTTYSIIELNNPTNNRKWIVSNNELYRDGVSVFSYIENGIGSTAYTGLNCLITNNIFDSNTIDGSTTDLIYLPPLSWLITNNISHSYDLFVRGYHGEKVFNNIISSSSFSSTIEVFDAASPTIQYNYNDLGALTIFTWYIPIIAVVPLMAKLVSINVFVSVNSVPTVTGTALLTARAGSVTVTDTDTLSLIGTTLSLTNLSSQEMRSRSDNNGIISLAISVNGAGAVTTDIYAMAIKYQW